MRVILASSFVPFIHGGARFIVEWLETKLCEYGHEVERFYLPFIDSEDLLLEQIMAYRLLDLSDRADALVAFRPPAYVLRHPNKILWFIHHIRGFYDLAGTPYQGYANTEAGRATRDALFDIDTRTIAEARKIFTNSQVVADRLRNFNGIDAEPLYPPLLDPERFYHRAYGNEVVVVCRVEPHKRQSLLIEAMRHTRTPVRLRLCGRSASPDYSREIQSMIRRSGAADRITYEDRWISEEEKVDYLAGALAVAYLPFDEDSYGYPSLEAAYARKPIITLQDAGGVLELVVDGRNGLVAEPTPVALARALDRLYADRSITEKMGAESHKRLSELKISWDHVVQSIVS